MSRSRPLAAIALLALLVSGAAAEEKPVVALPKDAKTVVLSYDPGAGGFIRKGEAPYLKIQADGQVTVTNLHDGMQKQGKLTAKELEDLLKFVVAENDFLNVTAAKLNDAIKTEANATGKFIALGGVGTSVVKLELADKKHEVIFRGAAAYLQTYPKAKVLPQYAAVEKKLNDLALAIVKGKEKGK